MDLVFDIHETRHLCGDADLMAWVRRHDADPSLVYRAELHTIDAPLVRFFEYATDEHGHRYADGDNAAVRPPRDVLLREAPPV